MQARPAGRWRTLAGEWEPLRRSAPPTPAPDRSRDMADPGTLRIAILDTDSGFVRVLAKRADDLGWQYRHLESPPRPEDVVAMRVNALVVDLAVLHERAWDYLEQLAFALPGMGIVVCTGRSTVAQR